MQRRVHGPFPNPRLAVLIDRRSKPCAVPRSYFLGVLRIWACTAADDRLCVHTVFLVDVLVLRERRIAALLLALAALTVAAAHSGAARGAYRSRASATTTGAGRLEAGFPRDR